MIFSSKKASSIIEAMVVLLIITSGIVGVYLLMSSSQKLANTTGNRIEAIQIARDGLEAMTNIRDTNWILFGADRVNCWNVVNYNQDCIGDISPGASAYDIILGSNEGFRISRDSNNRFLLSKISITSSPGVWIDASYRNDFQVFKDSRGFYTQGSGSVFNPLFTREMQVRYLDASGTTGNSNDDRMEIKAIVQWQDNGSTDIKKLEMDTVLTNWKK